MLRNDTYDMAIRRMAENRLCTESMFRSAKKGQEGL